MRFVLGVYVFCLAVCVLCWDLCLSASWSWFCFRASGKQLCIIAVVSGTGLVCTDGSSR
jgi:hypothetical protein